MTTKPGIQAGQWIDGYQAQAPAPLSYIQGSRTRPIGGHMVAGSWSDPWWMYSPSTQGWAVARTWRNPARTIYSWADRRNADCPARDEVVVMAMAKVGPGGIGELIEPATVEPATAGPATEPEPAAEPEQAEPEQAEVEPEPEPAPEPGISTQRAVRRDVMSYRNSYQNRRPAQRTGPRPNKYAGACSRCGLTVPAGTGILTGSRATGYAVRHPDRYWAGSLVSGHWAGGCEGAADAGLPAYAPKQAGPDDDLRDVSRRAGGRYAYSSSGARMTMSSRRCEDAPCCGCCD